jgi:hypothetical protein
MACVIREVALATNEQGLLLLWDLKKFCLVLMPIKNQMLKYE